MAQRTTTTIPTQPGLRLAATWHLPASGGGHGVAVVAPGVGVPARVMAPLADALADSGWEAISFDYPGIGASNGSDGVGAGVLDLATDRLRDWGGRDLDVVLRVAHQRAAGRPLVLVGHSAGAWLVGFTDMAAHVDAVVGLASMSGYWRDLRASERLRLLAFHRLVVPLATRLSGFLPARRLGLGEDLPAGVAREWAGWIARPGFFSGDPDVADELYLDALAAPVRVYRPTDDDWATAVSVDRLWQRYPAATVEHVAVDPADHGGEPIGHLGLMRPRMQATLWPELAQWLADATGVRPGVGQLAGGAA